MNIHKSILLPNYGSPIENIKQFGNKAKYMESVKGLEQELYKTGACYV